MSVGGQEKITLDLLLSSDELTPSIFGSKLIYEMDRIQDPEKKRYATYEVKIEHLCRFCKNPKVQGHLEYIHAHR